MHTNLMRLTVLQKTKKMTYRIQIFLIGILFLLESCSSIGINQINYESGYDNRDKIENQIKKIGVVLNLSTDEHLGKGIITIKDSKNGNKKETVFTVVRREYLENGSTVLISEVPTTEGMFEVQIADNKIDQKISFNIVEDWRKTMKFKTIFSSATINKLINSNGVICVKLKYKGQQEGGDRTIELTNEFYLEK